jgi:integrase
VTLSDASKEILRASCAKSTLKQYEGVMSKWKHFCESNNLNQTNPTIDSIINFLCKLYNDGLSYVSINTARSALSTFLGTVDGHSIGSHPLITRFTKGVSRLRPPTSKYNTTWDASIVLKFLSGWDNNDKLSLKDITLKLVSLLALCSAQRVQTLSSLLLSGVIFNRNSVIINISKQLKTTKPGQGLQMNFSKYKDIKLCLFSCLKEYVNRTADIRNGENLIIITKAPYGPACSQTISNWLKKVLDFAGIDINQFSSHSYRHSSTSKALSLGVSLDSIFKSAGWSENSKVFAKFYNKPIESGANYSNTILSSVRKSK